jgi:hypothetical protein
MKFGVSQLKIKRFPMRERLEYKTPRASVRGVFLCDNVADTIFSPVRKIDVNDWVNGGEEQGGDVYLAL